MSALGQKRTSELVQSMSALPPNADVRWLCLLGTFSRKEMESPKSKSAAQL
jgi:hypothetical protein